MTENEVIKIFIELINVPDQVLIEHENVLRAEQEEALIRVKTAQNMAIKALKEVQEYRKLGTVEEVRQAVEKTKAIKPNLEGDGYADGELVYDTWICPNCGERYEIDYDEYEHCPKCGQKIDFGGIYEI